MWAGSSRRLQIDPVVGWSGMLFLKNIFSPAMFRALHSEIKQVFPITARYLQASWGKEAATL